ncbi:MAG: DUF2953 domain-containing protein [Dorea sp.]|uniref:DUF2953 domain-containing protein n=1 Tax=Sporofaciens musculi TaxID=2681861 RepID=UPI00216E6805|nr:DUF2953 domain-containing protein [Sporofaciens musculi]MCI9423849.1 DUF2953 domain-containing protein [Dorea sp.]
MLHILLLILKIIGIIIAVILGILVLLVCVVLFVPVRYDMEAVSKGTFAKTCMKAKVTWLLHLVRVNLCYEDKVFSWQVRVGWKKIQSGQEEKKTIEAEVKTYDEEVDEDWEGFEEETDEELQQEPVSFRSGSEEAGKRHREVLEEEKGKPVKEPEEKREGSVEGLQERHRHHSEGPEEKREGSVEGLEEKQKVWGASGRDVRNSSKEPEWLVDEMEREMERVLEAEKDMEEEESADCKEQQEDWEADQQEWKMASEDSGEERETDYEGSEEEGTGIWQKAAGICQSIYQKIANLYRKIAGIPEKIGSTVEGLIQKVQGLLEKKDKIIEFLSDEIHQTAFMKARDEVLFLLRRLKPGTIQADIRYGFDDPSLTGKVLAGLSMCYPFLGDDVDIHPDFEKRVFNGQLKIAGWLRASYFLKLLWKLVWSKEVRMTYRHVRNFEL